MYVHADFFRPAEFPPPPPRHVGKPIPPPNPNSVLNQRVRKIISDMQKEAGILDSILSPIEVRIPHKDQT